MATTVLTAVEAIAPFAPFESVHIAIPPKSFAADDSRAERGIPLQDMDRLPELRHRTTQRRPSTNSVENDASSPESIQAPTPSSNEGQEQEQGNTLKTETHLALWH